MKIQCNVCEAAEAKLLCCADEAALCGACDQKVHAANKLASKHQRVPLSTYSSHMPKCDICQETVGHFFCLQDRSLLCRRCDVAIHTANSLVSAHDRFLLTGVTVGLEATESGPSSATGKANVQKKSGPDPRPVPKRTAQVSTDESRKNLHVQGGDFSSSELFLDGGSNTGGSIPQLQLDEFFELGDYNQNYDYMASSKDIFCGKFGVPDCSNIVEGDDCLGLGPDAFWTVPEIPSPPAASGLPWPKMTQTPSNSAVFVPDILSLPAQDFQYGENPKRRRRF